MSPHYHIILTPYFDQELHVIQNYKTLFRSKLKHVLSLLMTANPHFWKPISPSDPLHLWQPSILLIHSSSTLTFQTKSFTWLSKLQQCNESNACFLQNGYLRILTGKKHPKIKLQRLWKIRIWTFGLLVHWIKSF